MNESTIIYLIAIAVILLIIASIVDVKVRFIKGNGSWLKPTTWIKFKITKYDDKKG